MNWCEVMEVNTFVILPTAHVFTLPEHDPSCWKWANNWANESNWAAVVGQPNVLTMLQPVEHMLSHFHFPLAEAYCHRNVLTYFLVYNVHPNFQLLKCVLGGEGVHVVYEKIWYIRICPLLFCRHFMSLTRGRNIHFHTSVIQSQKYGF